MNTEKKYNDGSLAPKYFDPYSGEKSSDKKLSTNAMANYMLDDIAVMLDVPQNRNIRPFVVPQDVREREESLQNQNIFISEPNFTPLRMPETSSFQASNAHPMPPILSFEEFIAMKHRQSDPVVQKTKPKKTLSKYELKKIEKEKKLAEEKKQKIEKNEIRKIKLQRLISIVIILGFLSLPLGVLIVLNSTVFIAKNIRIEGISKYTDEDILTLSGIKRNQSLQAINIERAVHNIQKVHDLRVMDFRFIYPDGIYIRLQEKTPVAAVISNGFVYYLDKYGEVIEKLTKRKENVHYIEVKNCVMYQPTQSSRSQIKNQWQKDAYIEVMNAIVSLGVTNQFESLSILKDDNIYLTTVDNFVVNLGKLDSIGVKIANALAVKEYVSPGYRSGGLIDVSVADKPVFSNEDNKVLYERKYYLEPSPSSVYSSVEDQNAVLQSNPESGEAADSNLEQSNETSPVNGETSGNP